MSLRDELVGAAPRPIRYRILCPPGWRRVTPEALGTELVDAAADRLKGAGRPDLLLQLRSLAAAQQRAIQRAQTIEAYLPPLVDGNPVPAVLTVSPFVLPASTEWGPALRRLSKGAEVQVADFAEAAMWVWTRDERYGGGEEPSVPTRARHFVVPEPADGAAPTRALHFVFTVLETARAPESAQVAASVEPDPGLTEALLETADLILATMRWVQPVE